MIRSLALIVLLACAPALAQQHGTPQEASWRVQYRESDKLTDYGSATAVNPQLAVTAAHVIDRRMGAQVTLSRPDGLKVTGHAIAVDAATDVALLELDAGVRFVQLGPDPKIGETVTAYGYGRDGVLRGWPRGGQVQKNFRDGQFESTLTIESGDSGCGIFNASGQLVGVNSAAAWPTRIPGGIEGNSIAVPASAVLSLAQTACSGPFCQNNGLFNGWFAQPSPSPGPQNSPQPNRGQPVQPWPQAQQAPQAAPQASPMAAPDPRLDNHEQRLQALEGWAGGLKRLADSYPITAGKIPPLSPIPSPASPATPATPPAPPAPAGPAAPATDIGAILQPIVADAAAGIKDQFATDLAKLKQGTLTPADLQDSLNSTGKEIAGDIKKQIAQNPQAIAAAVLPAIEGAIGKIAPGVGSVLAGPLGAAGGVLLTSALAGLLGKLFGSKSSTPQIILTPHTAPTVQVTDPPIAKFTQTQPAGNQYVPVPGPDLLGEAYRQALALAKQFGKQDIDFVESLKNQILAGLKGQAKPLPQ